MLFLYIYAATSQIRRRYARLLVSCGGKRDCAHSGGGVCDAYRASVEVKRRPHISVSPPNKPELAQLATHIVVDASGCWLWQGSKIGGYAIIARQGRRFVVHRYLYELVREPVDPLLQLDHLCRVRHCVNPAHLEAVTAWENRRRGIHNNGHRDKTHCPAGHPYAGRNLYVSPTTQGRACKICIQQSRLKYRAKIKAGV